MLKKITAPTELALRSWAPSREGALSGVLSVFLCVLGLGFPLWGQNVAPSKQQAPASPPVAASNGYQLGPGDVVEIAVWQQPDLTRTCTVSTEGKLFFPPLMEIPVTGMTPEALDKYLTDALGKEYLKDPEVFVSIREFNSHEVLVLGHVPRPGLYKLKGDTSILSLLNEAGGVSMDAVGERLVITRSLSKEGSPPEDAQILIDLKKLLVDGDLQQNVSIQSGDRIFVPGGETSSVCVLGEVKSPGNFPYKPGMKVFGAIMSAGGPTEDASTSKVKIIRAGQKETLRANLSAFKKGKTEEDIPLEPGDFVIVPTGIF